MTQLRLLWSSNIIGCSSGYGVQSASVLPRLAQLPEFGGRQNIAQHAWYGLHGTTLHIDGFKIYPGANDPYGNDVIGAHMRDFGANIVITLIDAWVLQDTARKIVPALFLPWSPVDHDPVPGKVLESLRGAHMVLSYSKWGARMLSNTGVPNTYIPHGLETSVYRLLPLDDKRAEFKRNLTGIDNAHLTIMVAANKGFPDRKAFQVQLRAWAEFAKDKPDVRLYIHTEPTPMYGGIDFVGLITSLGLQGRVIFPDRYKYLIGYPAAEMAAFYNVADCYLGAAMSEGFGIPLIESQACGAPVVTTDFSAMSELVRWGEAVAPRDKFWTPMNSWQAWPDHAGITTALNRLHAEWMDNERGMAEGWQEQRRNASASIHAEYDWDAIVRDQWQPLMTRLALDAPPLDARFAEAKPIEEPVIHANGIEQPEAVMA